MPHLPHRGKCKKNLILKIMKLSAFFILFFVVTTSGRSLGQHQKVDLQLENATFYELLDIIRPQTGIRFIFHAEQINTLHQVNILAAKHPVAEVLGDSL